MKVTASPAITKLLNDARLQAIENIGPVDATRENLDMLADLIHTQIMLQVAFNQWLPHGVREIGDLKPLKVTAELGQGLLEPPIKIAYDFSKTTLPLLVVQ